MDSIKQTLTAAAATAKFDGIHVHVTSTSDSRLQLSVEASGSVNLPGNLDEMIAAGASLLGLGNSTLLASSSASPTPPPTEPSNS